MYELFKTYNRTLNFRLVESFKKLRNGQLGNWSSKQSDTFEGMRPFGHFREFINLMRSIDISIHLFIPDSSNHLITSRMVVSQWFSIIDIVGK